MPTPKRSPSAEPSQAFFGDTFSLADTEEKVLAFWRDQDIFAKSLALRAGAKPFVFYEGPPGANGKPGLHHVLSRVFKDVFLRYQTMRGRYVPRKSGWDTHGLPVELAAEKELGIKDKRDIEKYGVAAFNQKCQELVWEHEKEWKEMTERIGFWLDLDNPYVTYAPDYIESLWHIVKQIDTQGHLYRGHKIIPWCSRCGTGLSAAEVALGYQTVNDRTAYVKFKLLPDQKIGKQFVTDEVSYILAWTTTPWTLPGNVALAAGGDITYAIVQAVNGEHYVLAEDRVKDVLEGDAHVVARVSGSALKQLRYEPLMDVLGLRNEASHHVYTAPFVTADSGTGVVHISPMYGEDDYLLGKEVGLPQMHTVDENGTFGDVVPALRGMAVRAETTTDRIIELLGHLILRVEAHDHEYPHCWRCSTPLLYYAKNSWFVAMSQLREEMVARNQTVNWVPEHTKDGRFGNWLRDAKDWNFSRERYWGTPLPAWWCASCERHETVGSLDELHARSGGAHNQYWVMRHGEAEHNVRGVLDSDGSRVSLTKRGRTEALAAVEALRGAGIDLIVASPSKRTQETAHIVADALGVPVVTYDERLREVQLGSFSGKSLDALHAFWQQHPDASLTTAYPGGESEADVRRRAWYFLREMEQTHQGRTILVVGHDGPLRMLAATAEGWSDASALERIHHPPFLHPAGITRVDFRAIPRDEDGVVNLHRPYVDSVLLRCTSCDGVMHRTPETIDVWYDSGAMPYAQMHYPFAGKELVDGGKGSPKMYPADFIAEGVDQTRGWFYSLLEVATLLGRPAPYKNVISLGLLLDKHGKKMSKSKGNTVDAWDVIGRYGIDAVRWYFFSASDAGDNKNFDEAELGKATRRVHLIAYNTLSFWKLYGRTAVKASPRYTDLDHWIVARREETVRTVTKALDTYDARAAIVAVESLVDDLSRWYVRASRKRLQKVTSKSDYVACSRTLHETLFVLSQLSAPFAPFFAEALYHAVRTEKDPLSVHLTDWPTVGTPDRKLIERMALVRTLAATGLSLRAQAGIKVRQPLASLTIRDAGLRKHPQLQALLAAEVNVKAVLVDTRMTDEAVLDTTLTPALLAEGAAREMTRTIQELRQQAGLQPGQEAVVYLNGTLPVWWELYAMHIASDTTAVFRMRRITSAIATTSVMVDGNELWLGLKKG